MKDEIKEILDKPKILMLSYGNYISLDDYVKLKDYITNLQTIEREYSSLLSENAELQQKYDMALEDNVKESKRRMELQEERNNMACLVNDLQEKIDEATEYLKKNSEKVELNFYGFPDKITSFKGSVSTLLKILKGKSDEQ